MTKIDGWEEAYKVSESEENVYKGVLPISPKEADSFVPGDVSLETSNVVKILNEELRKRYFRGCKQPIKVYLRNSISDQAKTLLESLFGDDWRIRFTYAQSQRDDFSICVEVADKVTKIKAWELDK